MSGARVRIRHRHDGSCAGEWWIAFYWRGFAVASLANVSWKRRLRYTDSDAEGAW